MSSFSNFFITHNFQDSKFFRPKFYWDPNFFVNQIFSRPRFLETKNISGTTIFRDPKSFGTQNLLWSRIFLTQNYFLDQKSCLVKKHFCVNKILIKKVLWSKFFGSNKILIKKILIKKVLGPKKFRIKIKFYQTIFLTKIINGGSGQGIQFFRLGNSTKTIYSQNLLRQCWV